MPEQQPPEREKLNSRLDEIATDSADLHGNTGKYGYDRSLQRSESDYDENDGPGGASGLSDDPYLGGSTGLADDVGMHVEPGFSVGYEMDSEMGIDPDEGNDESYLSLGDAAIGRRKTQGDQGTGLETALGVPDAGELNIDGENLSLDMVDGKSKGYGPGMTDSDTDLNENS